MAIHPLDHTFRVICKTKKIKLNSSTRVQRLERIKRFEASVYFEEHDLLMNSQRHPLILCFRPILRIPAPMRDTVADAIMFPRKKIEIRREVSDFLYQVDMVYKAP